MKKKIALVLLLGFVLLGLTGCSSGGSGTDEVIEQSKGYDVYISTVDIGGNPVYNRNVKIDGETISSEGNVYHKKLEKGEYSVTVESSENYFGLEETMNVTGEKHFDLFISGRLNNKFTESNFGFEIFYPYGWELNKYQDEKANGIMLSVKDSENPYLIFVETENDSNLNTIEFEEYVKLVEDEYLPNNYDSYSNKRKVLVFENLAYEFTAYKDNKKEKIVISYYDNKIVHFYYSDLEDNYNYLSNAVYEAIMSTVSLKK